MDRISPHTTSGHRAVIRAEVPWWPGEEWFCKLNQRLKEAAEDQEALLLIFEMSCVGEGSPSPPSFQCTKAVAELEEFPHPVIGIVDGRCMDCCMELAAACDLLYATASSEFGFPSGTLPGLGGTQRLVRAVGLPRAKELYLAGITWSSQQALLYGFLSGTGASLDEARKKANHLADTVLTRSPMALTFCKEVVHRGYDLDLKNGCELEREVFSLCFTTHDQKEGMTAFAEKRRPRFEGLK